MKLYLSLIFLIIVSLGICSCQTKPFQIVFTSNENDVPTGLDEPQIYKLKKRASNADFNIDKLKNLDEHTKDSVSLQEAFEPVNGDYNYYQFLSTFKGRAYISPGDDLKDSVKVFHDILIVKTNHRNEIVDAFQYTLEWAEKPFQYDLYRSSIGNITLEDNMDISKLKFIRTEYWNSNDKYLKEEGVIKLK